jgi:hypothetical protein
MRQADIYALCPMSAPAPTHPCGWFRADQQVLVGNHYQIVPQVVDNELALYCNEHNTLAIMGTIGDLAFTAGQLWPNNGFLLRTSPNNNNQLRWVRPADAPILAMEFVPPDLAIEEEPDDENDDETDDEDEDDPGDEDNNFYRRILEAYREGHREIDEDVIGTWNGVDILADLGLGNGTAFLTHLREEGIADPNDPGWTIPWNEFYARYLAFQRGVPYELPPGEPTLRMNVHGDYIIIRPAPRTLAGL